jgi:hypothetical protein
MRDDDYIVYPSPMKCKHPNAEPEHSMNVDGTCVDCTYWRDMAIWESSPFYTEGSVY